MCPAFWIQYSSLTLIVSVVSIVVARLVERSKELAQRRKEIEQELRRQHQPIYQELVEFLFKIFTASKTGIQIPEDEINTFFVDFTKKTLVWGSDKFLKAFSAFRDSSALYAEQAKKGEENIDALVKTMTVLENLLYSIRADLGHSNKGLAAGDLLTLFINDVRNYIPKQ